MSSITDSHTPSSLFRIEPLGASNWIPWKRRSTAVARERGLLEYLERTTKRPVPADPKKPTEEETKAIKAWDEKDGKAQTQIELTISDSEMVHILGATTAHEMWTQLKTVKEARGFLGVMAARRKLYQTTAGEGVDIVTHISELRQVQEELHVMGNTHQRNGRALQSTPGGPGGTRRC